MGKSGLYQLKVASWSRGVRYVKQLLVRKAEVAKIVLTVSSAGGISADCILEGISSQETEIKKCILNYLLYEYIHDYILVALLVSAFTPHRTTHLHYMYSFSRRLYLKRLSRESFTKMHRSLIITTRYPQHCN